MTADEGQTLMGAAQEDQSTAASEKPASDAGLDTFNKLSSVEAKKATSAIADLKEEVEGFLGHINAKVLGADAEFHALLSQAKGHLLTLVDRIETFIGVHS